ncbi:MAG: TusE/DsrC/DsvC family sulfur relay protein [Cellvibrionaceae bacterium]
MTIEYNGLTIQTDKEGYLKHLSDWSKDIAKHIAKKEGVILTADHWELIELVRDFYETYELSPAMRPLIKFVSTKLEKEKSNSIYLLSLFPGSPAKLLSKIAGLPRPTNCL